MEHKENASIYGHSLDEQMHHYILEIIDLEEEITALVEVKIIYAFKHFEINLKRLIKAAYEDDNFVKNYRWETIKQYFALKKIDIKLVTNYNEVNQLRELNNAIKHSENYFTNENLKGLIPEFKKKNPASRELYKFYKRVEKCSTNFIQSISEKIYDDLYNFDDNKIEGIAESLAMRMEKKNLGKLILKLENFIKNVYEKNNEKIKCKCLLLITKLSFCTRARNGRMLIYIGKSYCEPRFFLTICCNIIK